MDPRDGIVLYTELDDQCDKLVVDKCVYRRSVSGGAGTASATAGRTPTQNVLVRQSSRLNSHRLSRQHCLVVSGGRCELGISQIVKEYFP